MRPPVSIKHHITKYGEDGARYAEAWVQVDLRVDGPATVLVV